MTKQMTSKFPGTCTRCRCRFPAGAPIVWSDNPRGARHATDAACDAAKAAAASKPVVTADGRAIVAFLTAAQARGLKFPQACFLAPGGFVKLSIAGDQSKYPGSVQVKLGPLGTAPEWIGRIEPSGVVANRLADMPDVLAALAAIAADPATAAKAYGMVAGRCSFCDAPITDAGSVEVGYGPTCAKRYGLPHTAKGTPKPFRQTVGTPVTGDAATAVLEAEGFTPDAARLITG
jgi:hypothetical protein